MSSEAVRAADIIANKFNVDKYDEDTRAWIAQIIDSETDIAQAMSDRESYRSQRDKLQEELALIEKQSELDIKISLKKGNDVSRMRLALQRIANSQPLPGSSRLWVEEVQKIANEALKGE